MALNITNQLREGKTLPLPGQNVIMKDPVRQHLLATQAISIPKNNIVSPMEVFYRFQPAKQIDWPLTLPAGSLIDGDKFVFTEVQNATYTTFRTLINNLITFSDFNFQNHYLSVSFDLVIQYYWSANPTFQGLAALNIYKNFQGIGGTLFENNRMAYHIQFPHSIITPTEDGVEEITVRFTLPTGSIPLLPLLVRNFCRHPYTNYIFGYYALFPITPLKTKSTRTFFSFGKRIRFANVSFGYLSQA